MLKYCDYLFPGYSLLSEEQRKQFESTPGGIKFVAACKDFEEKFPRTFWHDIGVSNFGVAIKNWVMPWVKKNYQPVEKMDVLIQNFIDDKKASLTNEIGEDKDYLNLKTSLVKIILEKILSDYHFYSTEFQDELANMEVSHELLKIVSIIDLQDKPSKDKIAGARQTFLSELQKLKITLPVIEKSRKLAMYMPFLKDNQKNDIDAIAVDKDLKAYIKTLIKNNFDAIFDNQEEKLTKFNQTIISDLAEIIYNAFDNADKLNYDEFFNAYEENLISYLKKEYSLLIGRKNVERLIDNNLMTFLSALFNDLSTVKNYIDKASDAHAFIQSVGGGSQGDNFILGFVDIYNSARYADEIGETKKTLLSLFSPLQPLLDEYKLIAHEKNLFLKILKILFPLLIVSLLVVVTSLLLAPLALPELVLAILIIPTLIISAVIAAQAVRFKNEAHGFLREKWYGSPFLIPEFQVNQRMQTTFANDAGKIRQFYIDEIQASNDLESTLQAKLDLGLLTDDELQQKSENLNNRCVLYIEWSLIHSNLDVGTDQAYLLASKRLASKVTQDQEKLDSENEKLITEFAEEAGRKLIHQFKKPPALNHQPHLGFFKPAENPLLTERKALLDTLAKAPMSP